MQPAYRLVVTAVSRFSEPTATELTFCQVPQKDWKHFKDDIRSRVDTTLMTGDWHVDEMRPSPPPHKQKEATVLFAAEQDAKRVYSMASSSS